MRGYSCIGVTMTLWASHAYVITLGKDEDDEDDEDSERGDFERRTDQKIEIVATFYSLILFLR